MKTAPLAARHIESSTTQPARLRLLRGFALRLKSLFLRPRRRYFFAPPPGYDSLPPATRLLENLLRPRINIPQLLRDLHESPLTASSEAPGRKQAEHAGQINLAVGLARLSDAALYRLWRKLGARRLAQLRSALEQSTPLVDAPLGEAKAYALNRQFSAMAEMLGHIEEGARQTLLARGYDFAPARGHASGSFGRTHVEAYRHQIEPSFIVRTGFLPAPIRARLIQTAKNASWLAASAQTRAQQFAQLAELLVPKQGAGLKVALTLDQHGHAIVLPAPFAAARLDAHALETQLVQFCCDNEKSAACLAGLVSHAMMQALTQTCVLSSDGAVSLAQKQDSDFIFPNPPPKFHFLAQHESGGMINLHLRTRHWIHANAAGHAYDAAQSFLTLEARFALDGKGQQSGARLLAASYSCQLLPRQNSQPLGLANPSSSHYPLTHAPEQGKWIAAV